MIRAAGDYTIYETATGKPLRRKSGQPVVIFTLEAGQSAYSGVIAGNQYLPGGIPTTRQGMGVSVDKTEITADGVDIAHISSIPPGAVLALDGESQGVINDGLIEITSTVQRSFSIKLTLWPYLDFEVVINAN